ncbi:MAG TPA: hypothetical protein VLF60_00680 [Candidatus Saccharimonadales bacterium]|nr:hypothetical protein [Candidatus Saccharimonadales bacterium]
MKHIRLQHDYAIVLQQVNDTGEEDFEALAESLRFGPAQLAHIIQELHHKGLIVSRNSSYGLWIRLSAKGKKFVRTLWPESAMAAY